MQILNVRITASIFLLGIIAFSGFQLWKTQDNYDSEFKEHDRLLTYKPAVIPADTGTDSPAAPLELTSAGDETVFNETIAELRKINNDIVGWITVDGTSIDYPFAAGSDNDFYLRHDINKNEAYAGTIFMDYRCQPDFLSFNTILYGHNMKNGSKFHDLVNFTDYEFFDTHKTGMIFLENENIPIEIFACMMTQPVDLYGFANADEYLAYLRAHKLQWRDEEFSADDRFITLSTCSYEFDGARTVIAAKIILTHQS